MDLGLNLAEYVSHEGAKARRLFLPLRTQRTQRDSVSLVYSDNSILKVHFIIEYCLVHPASLFNYAGQAMPKLLAFL